MTTAYDPSLLPAPADSERCAVHAERIDLDPAGSAFWVDELIVVDVPLPWPKPVWAADGFTAVPELVLDAAEAGRRIRVLAAVPLDDGIGRVVTHRLDHDATFARTEHHVDACDIVVLLERLLVHGLDVATDSVVSTEPKRELLLCTQGSHDLCCGSRGTSMWAELTKHEPTLSMRRVSHTGGHRMAPTGVTLPDGRMWGMATLEEMLGIVRADTSPASVARRCRGWIAVADGPAQVAERAVMAEVDDWTFDTTARTATQLTGGADADGITTIEVRTGDNAWQVEVELARSVPTIACGAPGGLPAKPGAEWKVRSISRVA